MKQLGWILALIAAVLGAGLALTQCGGDEAPEEGPDLEAAAEAIFEGEGVRWVDMTHTLDEENVYWPTAERFELERVAAGETEAGYWYAANNFSAAEHGGTHLDAPWHFAADGWQAHEIPMEALRGPAAVIDVRDSASVNRDYRVSVRDLEEWESEHGRLPEGAVVLVNTGWQERWPDEERVLGTDERGEAVTNNLHFPGREQVAPSGFVQSMLDSIATDRHGGAPPTAEDSAALRESIQSIVDELIGDRPETGPTQCHDITVYPAIGRAGGACEGYGLLLDITDPAAPERLDAVADSNFAYWHSATFDNEGETVLFTDEWGGGGQPKCRDTDPYEWGANAIFSREGDELTFQSYYKLPVVQTSEENCVAHNGSLIPVPGRDIMVQAWYQGGVSVLDFTDPANPKEIAYFDRGPVDGDEMVMGGSWSVYWYNGRIYSSEISRGLDVLELTPSPLLTENELEAARTVRFDEFNAQMQPKFEWPESFAKARAYLDQLERSDGLAEDRIRDAREALAAAENGSSSGHRQALRELADELEAGAEVTGDPSKVRALARALTELAGTTG